MQGTRHVALVGLMGTGKSTAGRIVARRLGRPYVDNDDGLEAAAGRTAREIQDDDGEEALHALELEVLRGALARTEPAVIGAAASVVDSAATTSRWPRRSSFG
jgi:shikimate kinase